MPNTQQARWTTSLPATWPEAPTDLTVSALKEIEACPRRWALSAASYPELWDGRGYPPRVHPSALSGSLVHAILETITKELVHAECPSIQDSSATAVLRKLGGLSSIIATSTARLIDRLMSNPRAAGQIEQIERTLRAQAAEVRFKVQTMLNRRQLPLNARSRATGNETARARAPLGFGVYCELELRAPLINWKGKADLLSFTPSLCELTDFKTGEHSDSHRFQLITYALIWSRDSDLNPSKRHVDRLVLAYPDGDVALPPPSASELDTLERELVQRSIAARDALAQLPPEARPAVETCRSCGVRQLCSSYWELPALDPGKLFGDVEATIARRHGPTSWDIVVENVPDRPKGLLRTGPGVDFALGERIRILDAAARKPQEGTADPIVVTIGSHSEIFTVAAT